MGALFGDNLPKKAVHVWVQQDSSSETPDFGWFLSAVVHVGSDPSPSHKLAEHHVGEVSL